MQSDEYESIRLQIKEVVDQMEITQDEDYFSALQMQYDILLAEAQCIADHELATKWDGESELCDVIGQLRIVQEEGEIQGTSRGTGCNRIYCESCDNDCTEEHKHAPCGHNYCPSCLAHICQLGLKNRSMIPARCCKREFPIEFVQQSLNVKEFQQYQAFLNEKNTVVGLISDQEYTNTVRSLGLKQCPSCGIGIERIYGCIHMTCPYGHEFCYTCLKKWRTCQCELYAQEELQQILQERAGNNIAARQRIQNILARDDDEHEHDWSGKIDMYDVRRAKRCFNCRRTMWQYYFECQDCGEKRCGSCRYHG